MSVRQEGPNARHDDAARAGWLYYVAGNTQDQIAAKLGVSRQSAQRLVSLAVSEGLVKVRIDHPIAECLELAARLRSRFALDLSEVVPSDPASPSTTLGLAEAAAAEIERRLRSPDPIVLAVEAASQAGLVVGTAEAIAARHLRERGLSIVGSNVRSRHGEIDLVMRDASKAS